MIFYLDIILYKKKKDILRFTIVSFHIQRRSHFFNSKSRLGLVSLANSVASNCLANVNSTQSSLNWFKVSV
jgi:hypothetical protein